MIDNARDPLPVSSDSQVNGVQIYSSTFSKGNLVSWILLFDRWPVHLTEQLTCSGKEADRLPSDAANDAIVEEVVDENFGSSNEPRRQVLSAPGSHLRDESGTMK